jgi:hypothetical protein
LCGTLLRVTETVESKTSDKGNYCTSVMFLRIFSILIYSTALQNDWYFPYFTGEEIEIQRM